MGSEENSEAKARTETDILADPHWFPEGFDSRLREFVLVAADRRTLSAQTFLDGRWNRDDCPHIRINGGRASGAGPETPARIIWHTGFCCSTLLTKALDRPNRNLSLCEPQILVEIAEARRTGSLSKDTASIVARHALSLLSRPFVSYEKITIKPSPAANALLQVVSDDVTGPMLFLYSDCKSFLISVHKMGEEGRKYIRRLFLVLLVDGHVQSQWPMTKLLLMSDLELAALVWHMQIAEFLRAWPKLNQGAIASLDCDAFLAAPEETLTRLDEFFALGIGLDGIRDCVASPLFRRNAKTGDADFHSERRTEEQRRIEQQLGGDLIRIVAQSYLICRDTPRTVPLPNPLVAVDKEYCQGTK